MFPQKQGADEEAKGKGTEQQKQIQLECSADDAEHDVEPNDGDVQQHDDEHGQPKQQGPPAPKDAHAEPADDARDEHDARRHSSAQQPPFQPHHDASAVHVDAFHASDAPGQHAFYVAAAYHLAATSGHTLGPSAGTA